MVGGGDYPTGIFGMEFSQPSYDYPSGSFQLDITFTFKKSVFFVDNIIICLGSGISSSNSATNITQVVNDILFCVFFFHHTHKLTVYALTFVQEGNEKGRRIVTSQNKNSHWLPLEQIIDFKILLTTHKILHDQSANFTKDI